MSPWTRTVILQDIVLAIVINTSAMLLTGAQITFPAWYPGTCSAFATNVVIQLVVPVPAIGRALSKPLEGRKGRFIWSIFVENFIYVTCISFTMACIQAAGRPVVAADLRVPGDYRLRHLAGALRHRDREPAEGAAGGGVGLLRRWQGIVGAAFSAELRSHALCCAPMRGARETDKNGVASGTARRVRRPRFGGASCASRKLIEARIE